MYIAVSLAGIRIWDHFVGRTRITEVLFYAGMVATVGTVLGIVALRVQQHSAA